MTGPVTGADLSLVPAQRLGALLSAQRTGLGLTIEEFVAHRASEFTPEELRRIELGRLPLDDDQISRLMRLYDVDSGVVVPERSELVVDLTAATVRVGGQVQGLPVDAGIDDVLARYLSLLYLLRGLEPGRSLTLRTQDLDVLSAALERSIGEVEQRLVELMGPAVVPWFQRLRHRLAVPAAGIVVGLSTVGGLLVIQFPDGPRAELVDQAATTLPSAQLGPATAAERGAGPATLAYVPGDPVSVGAAAAAQVLFPTDRLLGGWDVEFSGPREGYRGNTNTVTRTITIYVGPDDAPGEVSGVLAHELGHAFDVMYLDGATRAGWLELRGIEGPWWPDSGAADFHVGAGDFAEAFAKVVADSPSDAHAGEFDAAELAYVRELIERATR